MTHSSSQIVVDFHCRSPSTTEGCVLDRVNKTIIEISNSTSNSSTENETISYVVKDVMRSMNNPKVIHQLIFNLPLLHLAITISLLLILKIEQFIYLDSMTQSLSSKVTDKAKINVLARVLWRKKSMREKKSWLCSIKALSSRTVFRLALLISLIHAMIFFILIHLNKNDYGESYVATDFFRTKHLTLINYCVFHGILAFVLLIHISMSTILKAQISRYSRSLEINMETLKDHTKMSLISWSGGLSLFVYIFLVAMISVHYPSREYHMARFLFPAENLQLAFTWIKPVLYMGRSVVIRQSFYFLTKHYPWHWKNTLDFVFSAWAQEAEDQNLKKLEKELYRKIEKRGIVTSSIRKRSHFFTLRKKSFLEDLEMFGRRQRERSEVAAVLKQAREVDVGDDDDDGDDGEGADGRRCLNFNLDDETRYYTPVNN